MKKKHITKRLINSLFIGALLLIFQPDIIAQDRDLSYISYNFPNAKKNIIIDTAHTLSPFFEQLSKLQDNIDSLQVVSIVHLGDSHIQADFQTAVTRRLFQKHFGSAGRGLIIPLRLAKTNEPRSYKVTSPQVWEAVRCIKPDPLPVGIGGLTLTNKDSVSTLVIETLDKYNPDRWNFNDITIYCNPIETNVEITDKFPLVSQKITSDYTQEIKLDALTTNLTLQFASSGKKDLHLYGFNLKSGRNGILYHAIGINGAHYENYMDADLLSQQLGTLTPSLVIISLGTNEAYSRKFDPQVMYSNIDKTIKNIRQYSPNAVFILTTPAETWTRYKSKNRKPQPNVEHASKVIVKYAKDNGLSYWDLFSISGGRNSALSWRKHQLLSHDGVHFSKEGYEYLGAFFFEAIVNTYQEQTGKIIEK